MKKKILAVAIAALSFGFLSQFHDANATATFEAPIFQITGTGKLVHFEPAPFAPGVKAPVTNVTAAVIAACIAGTGIDCTGSNLEIDLGGKAYLYILDPTHIGVATNNVCSNVTVLEGLVDGGGNFMFTGHHSLSDTEVVVQGKVLFAKGTLTLIGIKAASILAISNHLEHYGIGKFSTVTGTSDTATCPVSIIP
jgi:hypothetical protein